jgi:S1-C subfamily serine protease
VPPSAAPPAAPPPGDGAAASASVISREDRAALASRLVVLERAGKPLAIGLILNSDGRILASLSTLGDARHVDARYADQNVVPVRVGHADRARDLALLVPENAKHRLGLRAAEAAAPALHAPLGSFDLAANKVAPGASVTPTGPSSFSTNDGKPFPEAIATTTPIASSSAGSPLVDTKGEVVALVARVCKRAAPGKPCTPTLAGIPVGVLREFLRAAPKTAAIPLPTLGFQGVPEDTGTARGIRVTSVRGPGLAAGLRAGNDHRNADLVVALDGVPVVTPDALDRALEDRAVGDVVDLLVLGGGRYRHVTAVVASTGR